MKSPLNIHPPKNWQDFETLCLKLWGEIWKIPHEIEFNSDNAQGQNGVDIFGPVNNGLNYNGIQCKNKKLNLINGLRNRITIKDIQEEIDKAKGFQPNLSKLIIATSLPKDQKVEEYVRKASVENIENGLFSIQICFWEFFERKLTEFPNVYNWYVKNEDFHRVKQISVKFNNGSDEIFCHPKFQKNIKRYVLNTLDEKLEKEKPDTTTLNKVVTMTLSEIAMESILQSNKEFKPTKFDFKNVVGEQHVWGQNCWLKLLIKNSGESVIEDFKIELDFEGDFEEVGAENRNGLFRSDFINDVKEYSNSNISLFIKTKTQVLVPDDKFITGNFYISLKAGEYSEIVIKWKLISRNFTDSGSLLVKVVPQYHTIYIDEKVSTMEEVREEISYELFRRPGIRSFDGINYLDKLSDYSFE